jgi:hypothetical protein
VGTANIGAMSQKERFIFITRIFDVTSLWPVQRTVATVTLPLEPVQSPTRRLTHSDLQVVSTPCPQT